MRNREKTRNHILQVAFEEIFRNGFQATSVNDIVAKTTVTKGAFFHYFPTKNDLGYAIVDEVITDLIQNRWIRPLNAYQNPIQGILAQLKKIIETSTIDELGLGCPLNNLIQEMSNVDPIFREKLNNAIDLWTTQLASRLEKGQKDGFIKSSVNAKQLAEFVVTAHEGGFGMSKSYQSKKMFWSVYYSLKDYLSQTSVKPMR